jgi:AcrR family transcriptional regulator
MSTLSPGAGGDPKQQLLERALGYLAEHGIGDISLRELAAALGTSHRMLIYHFGSKEGLFVAVVQESENQLRRLLADSFGPTSPDLVVLGRDFWRRLRSPCCGCSSSSTRRRCRAGSTRGRCWTASPAAGSSRCSRRCWRPG